MAYATIRVPPLNSLCTMLVQIKGEHGVDVVMFGDVAKKLFRMMDLSGNLEGALKHEDLPAALARLEDALSHLQEPPHDDDEGDAPVSLNTRALPLIDLMKKNIAAGGYVMWQTQ